MLATVCLQINLTDVAVCTEPVGVYKMWPMLAKQHNGDVFNIELCLPPAFPKQAGVCAVRHSWKSLCLHALVFYSHFNYGNSVFFLTPFASPGHKHVHHSFPFFNLRCLWCNFSRLPWSETSCCQESGTSASHPMKCSSSKRPSSRSSTGGTWSSMKLTGSRMRSQRSGSCRNTTLFCCKRLHATLHNNLNKWCLCFWG